MDKLHCFFINSSFFEAAGGVGTPVGKAPVMPRMSSATQQKIVDIGIMRSVSENIHWGQQGKHVVGYHNYTPGRSILTEDANNLLRQYHSGETTVLRIANNNKIIVEFNRPIGTYIKQGALQPTSAFASKMFGYPAGSLDES